MYRLVPLLGPLVEDMGSSRSIRTRSDQAIEVSSPKDAGFAKENISLADCFGGAGRVGTFTGFWRAEGKGLTVQFVGNHKHKATPKFELQFSSQIVPNVVCAASEEDNSFKLNVALTDGTLVIVHLHITDSTVELSRIDTVTLAFSPSSLHPAGECFICTSVDGAVIVFSHNDVQVSSQLRSPTSKGLLGFVPNLSLFSQNQQPVATLVKTTSCVVGHRTYVATLDSAWRCRLFQIGLHGDKTNIQCAVIHDVALGELVGASPEFDVAQTLLDLFPLRVEQHTAVGLAAYVVGDSPKVSVIALPPSAGSKPLVVTTKYDAPGFATNLLAEHNGNLWLLSSDGDSSRVSTCHVELGDHWKTVQRRDILEDVQQLQEHGGSSTVVFEEYLFHPSRFDLESVLQALRSTDIDISSLPPSRRTMASLRSLVRQAKLDQARWLQVLRRASALSTNHDVGLGLVAGATYPAVEADAFLITKTGAQAILKCDLPAALLRPAELQPSDLFNEHAGHASESAVNDVLNVLQLVRHVGDKLPCYLPTELGAATTGYCRELAIFLLENYPSIAKAFDILHHIDNLNAIADFLLAKLAPSGEDDQECVRFDLNRVHRSELENPVLRTTLAIGVGNSLTARAFFARNLLVTLIAASQLQSLVGLSGSEVNALLALLPKAAGKAARCFCLHSLSGVTGWLPPHGTALEACVAALYDIKQRHFSQLQESTTLAITSTVVDHYDWVIAILASRHKWSDALLCLALYNLHSQNPSLRPIIDHGRAVAHIEHGEYAAAAAAFLRVSAFLEEPRKMSLEFLSDLVAFTTKWEAKSSSQYLLSAVSFLEESIPVDIRTAHEMAQPDLHAEHGAAEAILTVLHAGIAAFERDRKAGLHENSDNQHVVNILWNYSFKFSLCLGLVDRAYNAILAQKDESLRASAFLRLVSVLCERKQHDVLMRLPAGKLRDEIQKALVTKAQGQDIGPALLNGQPVFFQILYSFYVYQGNYYNAAQTMYRFARELTYYLDEALDDATIDMFLRQRIQALSACLCGLGGIDERLRFVALTSRDEGSSVKLDGKKSVRVLSMQQIQLELCSARSLARLNGAKLAPFRIASIDLNEEELDQLIVTLVNAGFFDDAIDVLRHRVLARHTDAPAVPLAKAADHHFPGSLRIIFLRLVDRVLEHIVHSSASRAWLKFNDIAAAEHKSDSIAAMSLLASALIVFDGNPENGSYTVCHRIVCERVLERRKDLQLATTPEPLKAVFVHLQQQDPAALLRIYVKLRVFEEEAVQIVEDMISNQENTLAMARPGEWALPTHLVDAVAAQVSTNQQLKRRIDDAAKKIEGLSRN